MADYIIQSIKNPISVPIKILNMTTEVEILQYLHYHPLAKRVENINFYLQ